MSNLVSLNKIHSGKVRDLYEINDDLVLMVASDRISAFDLVLNQQIPDKGIYLTQISLFWFDHFSHIKNHLIKNFDLNKILTKNELNYCKNRTMVVSKLKPLAIEFIVRGYLAGSAYSDYLASGRVGDHHLKPDLQNGVKLSKPIFTPSTKAIMGMHDRNISIAECKQLIGDELTVEIEKIALTLYTQAAVYALKRGIIIADTKFEFAVNQAQEIILIDEIFTPDSSRFWNSVTYLHDYQQGINPSSFDKQLVRDYLINDLHWNKKNPIPDLTEELINQTKNNYQQIMTRFTHYDLMHLD